MDSQCSSCGGFCKKSGCERQNVFEPGPVAWMPIEHKYPKTKPLDILMADGSILRGVFPQFDGNLWWEGSGTGEKFINPEYADITH